MRSSRWACWHAAEILGEPTLRSSADADLRCPGGTGPPSGELSDNWLRRIRHARHLTIEAGVMLGRAVLVFGAAHSDQLVTFTCSPKSVLARAAARCACRPHGVSIAMYRNYSLLRPQGRPQPVVIDYLICCSAEFFTSFASSFAWPASQPGSGLPESPRPIAALR